MAVIKPLLDDITYEFSLPEPKWVLSKMANKDLEYLRGECLKESEFDPSNKRNRLFEKYMKGEVETLYIKCKYGKIFCILENTNQIAQIPIGLWVRILRMYSEEGRKPFKVFFLAISDLRTFPKHNEQITPENINGGYTYRCNPETILIYRAEDATRVLLHELMHSCCLDKVENGVDWIEAETEAWAELVYIGVLSQGKKYIFNDLLKRQSEWIRKQNVKVKRYMVNPNSMEFPWRYTIGKEEIWKKWNILGEENMKPEISVGNSLRLTFPPNNILKERFKVTKESTIL
jgi:hypothetical protein